MTAPWSVNRVSDRSLRQLDTYDVYAVSYGSSLFREDKIIMGGDPKKKVPFEWYFWVISGNNRVILVDTGFNNVNKARKLGFARYAAPVKRLKRLGISPEEVTDIVLTHTHWDHAGGLKPFNKANVWIQQKEYDLVKSNLNKLKSFSKQGSYNHLPDIFRVEEEGRLKIINGENEPTPNVYLIQKGTHTAGSQYVKVKTIDGWVVLASDAAYLYRNIERHLPTGTSGDHTESMGTIREMHKIAVSPTFIIPGHDPLVLKMFPKVAPGIVRISTLE